MDLALLNPPQRAAVEHGQGPLLVLAGAGSGKTRVITYRIARLLQRGVPASAICAVTFTNKAAGEMRERVAKIVRNKQVVGELTIGTFHALGLELLRHERAALGFPRGFAVYDASDQLGVVRELMRRRKDDGDRRYDVKAILSRISLAKNAFIAPDEYQPNESDEYDVVTADIYPRYQDSLRAFAALDFDDLITETVRLLDRDHMVRERWATRYQQVLVDEFQDTNRAQLLMVRHLADRSRNLCVVGDDDQSIYAWRGADTTNILQFERLFHGAVVVKLEQNYRSTPQILAAANAVIAHNSDRHGKTLWSDKASGAKLQLAVVDRPEDEAIFVANEIDRLRGEGTPLADMAVMYRSNIQTGLIEEALRERDLAYRMFGGQQFYERKEVKDLIAYLRLALSARDEISLRRIINYPARGVGPTTLEAAARYAESNRMSLWSALLRIEDIDGVKPGPAMSVRAFTAVIQAVQADLRDIGVAAATRQLVERIELHEDLRQASPSPNQAQRRIDNISNLVNSLHRHEARQKGPDALAEYLRRLALDTQSEEEGPADGDRLTLTTLHGAKGLEFPIVFLIGFEEEIIPHARTLMPSATDVNDPDHAASISEERRLCYVGITRAQTRLYISRCRLRRKHGREVERTPSRFLSEIPEALVDPRDVVTEAKQLVDPGELRRFFQRFGAD